MKIIICVNTAWNLVNFRAGLIRALVVQGHEVLAIAPKDKFVQQLADLGCRFEPIPMHNGGTNLVRDAMLLWRFFRLFQRERPDIYMGYTIKPNVYGSLAAQILGVRVINNIAGLGAVFIKNGLLVRLVRWLYRIALKRSAKVFFQNDDDRQLFIKARLVRTEITDLLPGSGIDLNRFAHTRLATSSDNFGRFRFLLVARMLRDKGVGEYVAAATLLHRRWPLADFCLLGFLDVENPAAISGEEMAEWVSQGFVNYLGVREDVRNEIAKSDCVVLPSYREGTPRSLLEAAAMGRPIITTDAVGCREVVDDGLNGYLCKVRDVEDLAAKMEKMMSLSALQRLEMGAMGRKKMEHEFDEQIVINKYLAAVREVATL